MKTKFFYTIVLVLGLTFAGSTFNNMNGQTPKKTTVKTTTVMYTCPEHPEYVSNKPGKCPKCGMALVKKDNSKKKQDTKTQKMSM
jgi:predicted RNA-binding Zn-ribbon protein involved in translation (DUF1610 family)